MRTFLLTIAFLAYATIFAQKTTKTITGKITDGENPIENVSVDIKGKSMQTFSDASGKYTIEATIGDHIVYSYQGLKTIGIRVEDVTRILNISMIPDVEELDEVTIVGSNRKTQKDLELEYSSNPRIIRTAFGYLNADTAPGQVRFMYEDQISQVTICILDLLRNEFAGVRVEGDCSGTYDPQALSDYTNVTATFFPSGTTGVAIDPDRGINNLPRGQVFIRGFNSVFNPRPAIFDIDGQLFKDTPLWIDVKNIKRIGILNNLATTTRYGNEGAGGVIVINTLSANQQPFEIFDRAKLRNNFVSKNILGRNEVRRNWPTYLKELENSAGLEEAKNIFSKYEKVYAASPYFTLDAQKYFQENNDGEFADGILSKNQWAFGKNPVLLKALAYQFQEQSQFEKANALYKEIMKLRPNYAQSFMDLANGYRETGDYEKALNVYNRYFKLVQDGYLQKDTVGFGPMMEREYNNFLFLNKGKVLSNNAAREVYVAPEEYQGTRLVFEWNDGEAEFQLQFVNPGDQYHLFKHDFESNSNLIDQEKEIGYNTAEYYLDNSLPGLWKINVHYQGNKSTTPTYLKTTVYYNYGSISQRKETRVFKLTLKDVPYELFAINTGDRLVLSN